ncbi:MAG: hypothetical protein WDN66_03780 [Candidatus Saccharibacteria bacterium]
MYNKTLANGREEVIFNDPREASIFAAKGIPQKHPFKSAVLSLRALVSVSEPRNPLSVTLPTSSLEQGAVMLAEEARRLEHGLNPNIAEVDREIDANPSTIAVIRELGDGINLHLGKTAINS